MHVIGIGGRLVVRQVARNARGVGQVVVSVDVTLGARCGHVRSSQGETRLAVIECRISPRRRGVATGAGGRDSGLGVIGVRRSLEILHVARNAIRRSAGELAVHVALRAGNSHMGAGQREFSERVVIEGRGLPGRGGVAALASLRESRLHVIRIRRLLEIGEMAAHAGRGRSGKLPSYVTGGAIQRNMCSRQREPG